MPSSRSSLALRRALVSLLVIWHLAVVAAALALETAPGAAVRRYTRGYERLVGIYQGWDMFAPNPPRADTWMELEGIDADGQRVALDPLVGARGEVWLELRYLRGGKLERNLLTERRREALRRFAAWKCRQHPGLRRIEVTLVRRRTPTPEARRAGEDYALARERALEARCPR